MRRLIPKGIMNVRTGRADKLFCVFMKTKKTRNARTIILPAVSRRDLCYASENEGFRFYNIRTYSATVGVARFLFRLGARIFFSTFGYWARSSFLNAGPGQTPLYLV